jgi:ABC-2 type transport system permease protein
MSPPTTGHRPAHPLVKITAVEARLFLRDAGSVFFALSFPAVLLLLLGGVMPGFLDAAPDLGGRRPIDIYLPVVIILAVATTAITTLPVYLATYREKGVLRRLATTPARPVHLLAAQLLVNLAATALAILLALVVGMVVFGVPGPANVVGFVVAVVFGTAAMFGLGLLVAAVVPNARVAGGVGMLLYFPTLFLAGVWLPGPLMPAAIRRISEWTPPGALAEALPDTWAGAWPAPPHLAVLAAYLVVTGAAAARLFRWE